MSVRAALADLDQSIEDIRPWVIAARNSSLGGWIRRLPKNPPKWTRLSDVIPGYRKHFTLKRASWGLPAPTLTVMGQSPSGPSGIIHPDQDRKFTIPELKRLTGLPDDFILTGTLAQAAERICRMVPPPATKAIAESVYKRVLKPFKERGHE